MGEMVEFSGETDRCSGYLAVPGGDARGPGVIVIQEWWGLVPQIVGVCDRLADEGFVALAPDLYHGEQAPLDEPDKAQRLMHELRTTDAARDLGGAIDFLRRNERVNSDKLGVVGFCMGGGLALYVATQRPEIAATVAYYGVGASDQADLSQMKSAVLGHWAEQDSSYDHAKIDNYSQKLVAAGVEQQMYWYDADHAFFNEERPAVYDPAASRLSWQRTLDFLRAHIRPGATV